jgi:peptidoglycan-N-acetylglucosamine deacetylase
MIYWSTANRLLKFCYPTWRWDVPDAANKIYLSFDDGPHPIATPFVLAQLAAYRAKASFFCIGKNVLDYPDLYAQIVNEGHSVGNHTMHHKNAWHTSSAIYLNDIKAAESCIGSKLFRPPYGKLRRVQGRALINAGWEIVMWTVLSGDFDTQKNPSDCWDIVRKHTSAGAIVLFHDSEKAWPRMKEILPKTLDYFSSAGYTFEQLNMNTWSDNNQ